MKIIKFLVLSLMAIIALPSLFPAFPGLGEAGPGPWPLSNHNPISINGNAGFTAANGVVTGNGTKATPYIIENLTINASTGHGIRIQNTDKYFIIRNCTIFNGTYNSYSYYGIYLTNVDHGTITNNTIYRNYHNIDQSGSDDITIINNAISIAGLYFTNVNQGTIENNTISGGDLNLFSSDDFTIVNNSISLSGADGLYIQDGNNEVIQNNTLHDNVFGLRAVSGNNNTFIGNKIDKSLTGVIDHFTSSKYIDNDIHNNTDWGMQLYGDHNQYTNNTVTGNSCDGIWLEDSNSSVFSGNNVSYNNWNGVKADSSNNNTYQGNLFSNNVRGGFYVYLTHIMPNNTFINNTFKNNIGPGFTFYGIYANILNNTFTGGDDALIQWSPRSQISGNKVTGQNLVANGLLNTVSNNTVTNGKLYVNGSWDCEVFGNKDTGGDLRIYSGGDNNIFDNEVTNKAGLSVTGVTNSVYDNKVTYISVSGNGNQIFNNTVQNGTNQYHTTYGIWVQADDNIIENNTLRNNDNGIWIRGSSNIVDNNTISDSNNNGFGLDLAYDTVVSNNTVYNDTNGFDLQRGDRNLFIGNDIYYSRSCGIKIDQFLPFSSNGATFKGNRIFNNDVGIWVPQTTGGIKIDGNIISDNTKTGLLFYSSDNHLIANNTLLGNPQGIFLNDSDNINIYNNSIYNSNVVGLHLERAQTDHIYNNFIVNCSVGLNLTNSNFTLAYNNYVNNTANYKISGGTGNQWDTAKTLGTNIVNGMYLGGSYWSNYTGADTDSDGIGNTKLPYGPGDTFPLVQQPDPTAPGILDRISWGPTTGDPFMFKASAWDNMNLRSVIVRYHFDKHAQVNQSMDLISGNMRRGTFTIMVAAPSYSFDLYYNMTVTDLWGNVNQTGWKKLLVVDNDLPTLSDNTVATPTTGDNFTLNATAHDNINVSQVRLDYQFGQSAWALRTLNLTGSAYLGNISVPSNATLLRYKLSARDNSSNSVALTVVVLPVLDNDRPTITDLTGSNPRTGLSFNLSTKVTDNINVSKVLATYWFDSDAPKTIVIDPQGQDEYNLTLNVPDTASLLHYNITASDRSMNRGVLPTVDLQVQDIIPPSILDTTGAPQTGKALSITCTVTENIAVATAEVEYWFDAGTHTTKSLLPTYSYAISVPTDARVLHYNLTVKDTSNNTDKVPRVVNVIDTISPIIKDLTTMPTTGENLTFSFNISDNWAPKAMTVEFWFDAGPHTKADLSQTVTVQVPSKATRMSYDVNVNDTSGNKAKLHIDRMVLDNDRPVLKDLSGTPSTGQTFIFNFTYSDNTGVTAAYLEYRFNDGAIINVSYKGPFSVRVPDGATVLNYTMKVLDKDGNFAQITRDVAVPDTEPPIITDLTATIIHTGDTLDFQAYVLDNIAVYEFTLTYWFDGKSPTTKSLPEVQGSYSLGIVVPVNAKALGYLMTAKDPSGNVGTVGTNLTVRDSILPTITDHTGSATTGEGLVFRADISDNIGVTSMTLEYWYNDGTRTTASFVDGMSLQVPVDAQKLSYILHAKDAAGNERTLRVDKVVKDNDPPVVTDRTTGAPEGNKDFTVSVSATDNIALSSVSVTYWFDEQTDHRTVVLSRAGLYYSTVLPMAPKGELHYVIGATDTSNNNITGQQTTLSIKPVSTARPGKAPISNTLIVALVLVIVVVVLLIVALVIKRMSRIGPKERIVEEPVHKGARAHPKSKGPQGPKVVAETAPVPKVKPVRSEEQPEVVPVKTPLEEVPKETPKPKATKTSSKAWEPRPKTTEETDKASPVTEPETPKKAMGEGPEDKKGPPKDILDEILES